MTAHTAIEANYDGLIGPTHNYGGLSDGNFASKAHEGLTSRPQEAVLQGLAKMKRLADRGLVQGVLPPHERPYLPALRAAGFTGDDHAVLAQAWNVDARLVRNVSSASPMWAANAATVSPSTDTRDGRVHFTPANLNTMLHRAIEPEQTERALKAAFPDETHFCVHPALPQQAAFSDEGAANHVRLAADHGSPGVAVFVYGRGPYERPTLDVPARQSLLASQSIARAHGLDPRRVVFARQSDAALNAGAFHNDVVGVGSCEVMFYQADAFVDEAEVLNHIRTAAQGLFEPVFVAAPRDAVSLPDAVKSYLFNSQLLRIPGQDGLVLVAPTETRDHTATGPYCAQLTGGNGPIRAVEYVDVRQSMSNGGGPACLRLRVVLTPQERAAANPRQIMNDDLYDALTRWARAHYRETLAPNDVADPDLLNEARTALDELTGILGLGSDFYPFQRV